MKVQEIKEKGTNLFNKLSRRLIQVEREHPYTLQHLERVRRYSLYLGRLCKLNPEEILLLDLASRLHDIGKVKMVDLIQEPRGLTQEEFEMVKQHPKFGYEIVAEYPLLKWVAEAVYSHHERWDGKGYPRGLKGEKIYSLARIVAITESFDAMLDRNRPYKNNRTLVDAIKEIKANAGTQFNKDLALLFISNEDELRQITKNAFNGD